MINGNIFTETLKNLDNIDFTNINERLNSPRSLEACRKCGVDPLNLYYVEQYVFKNNNPEMRALPKDIQRLRFDHFDKLREKNISLVQEVI